MPATIALTVYIDGTALDRERTQSSIASVVAEDGGLHLYKRGFAAGQSPILRWWYAITGGTGGYNAKTLGEKIAEQLRDSDVLPCDMAIEVTVVGFSRGCLSGLHMVDALKDLPWTFRFLGIDPCLGSFAAEKLAIKIPAAVTEYIGLYATQYVIGDWGVAGSQYPMLPFIPSTDSSATKVTHIALAKDHPGMGDLRLSADPRACFFTVASGSDDMATLVQTLLVGGTLSVDKLGVMLKLVVAKDADISMRYQCQQSDGSLALASFSKACEEAGMQPFNLTLLRGGRSSIGLGHPVCAHPYRDASEVKADEARAALTAKL